MLDTSGNPILKETTINKGAIIDRYGIPNGRFAGLQNSDGSLARYDQRSMAYTEESNTMYNQYEVKTPINTETLTECYNSLSPDKKQQVLQDMDRLGLNLDNYLDANGDIVLHVYTGEIAPAYGLPGGGNQASFPVTIKFLIDNDFLGPKE